MKRTDSKKSDNAKLNALQANYVTHDCGAMTTDQGIGIANTDDSLKAGGRGPTLMEDFIFREKITHFDHERIPERIVHARGFGAHGHFQVYESQSSITKAHFLSDPALVTPVFVRFSTVAGFRGSADTVRDVRGFAVKFYTQEGNCDIVGNNMPVFFISDAIKFPDLVHALKPEPHNEIPQAASAHDTFWDFIANNPETAHNMMWLMSDRAIPKSYRMMEGFGINTYKFINAKGQCKFVRYHWKPLLGVHSLVWDETQKIAGVDPDFNRRDLWENIFCGNFPEWELGIQLIDPKDEFKFGFDILDATKLWPEELVPVTRIGKMTLDHNVTNYFAETEQVAFCPANIVPGIDFSNDPLLQGRLFSYLDTQLSRLGGPNFHQIPINRPLVKVNNNQRDGMHRMTIDEGITTYFPNALNKGEPHPAGEGESAYAHHQEKVEGYVIRARSDSFRDFYSQPIMFWHSLAPYEQKHIINAFRFELGKVKNKDTRQAVVNMLNNIDGELSKQVALCIGAVPPANLFKAKNVTPSPALSQANTISSAKTRKVAILLECGFDKRETDAIMNAAKASGATCEIISGAQGVITAKDNRTLMSTQTYATTSPVLYDALYIPSGKQHSEALKNNPHTLDFVNNTFKHCKPLCASGDSVEILRMSPALKDVALADNKISMVNDKGVITSKTKSEFGRFTDEFIAALNKGRFFEREDC